MCMRDWKKLFILKIEADIFHFVFKRIKCAVKFFVHIERFRPTFDERGKSQTLMDLRGISKNWFKNQFCPSIRLSRLRAQSASMY
jgi:hypothetical protein